MIIVTGAAGFIGSCLTTKLNNKGIKDIILVDDFSQETKNRNFANKTYRRKIERKLFLQWLDENHSTVEFIFHIGARTDTTEFNSAIFDELNLQYSKKIWKACSRYAIPMIYASSAATYGDGTLGYRDDHALIPSLQPLNPYGVSKNDFDKWVLLQEEHPPFWYGLKFFNVYGPNEYHKGRMASVIFHAFQQASSDQHGSNGKCVTLFRSHHPGFHDGEQLRDFVYVKDVVDVLFFLMTRKEHSGIYNLGTGKARTFVSLATAVFTALNQPINIQFIDTPLDIRNKYQYFTEADMTKLQSIGYDRPFHTLESGIEEYVKGYLLERTYY